MKIQFKSVSNGRTLTVKKSNYKVLPKSYVTDLEFLVIESADTILEPGKVVTTAIEVAGHSVISLENGASSSKVFKENGEEIPNTYALFQTLKGTDKHQVSFVKVEEGQLVETEVSGKVRLNFPTTEQNYKISTDAVDLLITRAVITNNETLQIRELLYNDCLQRSIEDLEQGTDFKEVKERVRTYFEAVPNGSPLADTVIASITPKN